MRYTLQNKFTRTGLLTAFLFFLVAAGVNAQNIADAEGLYKKHNYLAALEIYLKLWPHDKFNHDLNHKIGLCYLYGNIDKSKGVSFLEYVSKVPDYDKKIFFDLARAYHYSNRFDEAITNYNKYLKVATGKESSTTLHLIEQCNNGKQLIKKPLDVTFENLGKDVNTAYPEYYPFIPANESFVVFTSRRKGNTGNVQDYDGYYTSDLFQADIKNGIAGKAKNMGPLVNTDGDEQVTGMPNHGKTMMIYVDHGKVAGDIFITHQNKGKGFLKPALINANINTTSMEYSASINQDSTMIVFSSNMPGGLGGTDLWVVKRLPDYTWSLPQNLGPQINTRFNEDFPNIFEDGSLYFASEGHNSMGGFDIFKALWDEEHHNWAGCKNIGYPLSTSYDDMTISFNGTSRVAYLSAIRPEGFGDYDLYRVTINESENRKTLVACKLIVDDPAAMFSDAIIDVYDEKKQSLVGSYQAKKGGKFFVILSPGTYRINIEMDGYKAYTETFKVADKAEFVENMEKNFTLIKN